MKLYPNRRDTIQELVLSNLDDKCTMKSPRNGFDESFAHKKDFS